MEGVIVLHETIHEMDGIIFKIYLEKAYEKINWYFIQQTLRMKGFSSTWCKWVASFMEGGHIGIKINDQVGTNFQTKKELNKGIHYHLYYSI
jgi:hypothetical protein